MFVSDSPQHDQSRRHCHRSPDGIAHRERQYRKYSAGETAARGESSMTMTRAVRSSQQGFALVAALFLMVVIAVLGTYAVRIGSSQQGGTNLELGSAGAEAALQSGIQYAAARLTTNSN